MDSSVAKFFENGHILVTGGTGFMGKVLIDKLIRTCNLDMLYLLIRVKKGKEPNTRLKELFDDPIFNRLKNEYPNYLSKVTVIAGDCSSPGLGMSEADRENMSRKLTHIFHGAATVRFDEKLRHAISVNVLGVQEMMLFCQSCQKLKSVLHTSTAYANCPLQSIQEHFYTPPMSGECALNLLKCMDDAKLNTITPELIKPWPNTYSYTKAIAEEVVQKLGKGLPIAVFRPSIVIGTATEPVSGWIDNLYGPTGVVVGVGAGLMRVLYADGDIMADLVPVDMAVNAIICAAWDIGRKYEERRDEEKNDALDIPIYHFVVSRENALTWKQYLDFNFKHGRKIPSIKAIWYYTLTITNVWALYRLLTVVYHLIPALIMDAGLLLSGNKAQMWRAYQKIHKFSGVISNFSTKEWFFGETNTRALWSRLSPADQQLFQFDMTKLDWDQYFKSSVEGVRTYLFLDNPSTLPAARRKMFLLHIAHRLLQATLLLIVLWGLYAALGGFVTSQADMLSQFMSSRWESRKTLVTA